MKWLISFSLIVISTAAFSQDNKYASPHHPKWKEECGSCHVTFPPQLLTKENWRQLMSGLEKHFGVNATLDDDISQEILAFLLSQAGTEANGHQSKSGMRITDTPWFDRKHGKMPEKTWSQKSVKSKSNCKACHMNADRGVWYDHDGAFVYCKSCHDI